MSSLITFLWYYPASYQHPGTLIQLTFLHFDLKSVSCLESFNRYCTSIRENEASKPVLLILNHLSWFLVVSASFILFLFFFNVLRGNSFNTHWNFFLNHWSVIWEVSLLSRWRLLTFVVSSCSLYSLWPHNPTQCNSVSCPHGQLAS